MSLAQDDGSAGKVERQDQELWQLNDLLKKEDGHAPALKSTSQDDVTTYFAAVADEDDHERLVLHREGVELHRTPRAVYERRAAREPQGLGD